MAPGQPVPTWAMAEAFVTAQAPAFATLHLGFADQSSTAKGRFTYYHQFINVLVLAARVAAHHGDWAGATECSLDMACNWAKQSSTAIT